MVQKVPKSADDAQIERLFRGASVFIPSKEIVEDRLRNPRRPLRVKLGIDPTAPDLHFGYLVILRRLKLLQELGHQLILLIGGFTARFGDPTDRTEVREFREGNEVRTIGKKLKRQFELVIETEGIEMPDNSDWYDNMSAEGLLKLMSKVTVAQMLERDMFKERKRHGKPIGLHEPVYPLLQGYDSVEIRSDMTVVGTDQVFNENVARSLQERRGQEAQMIIGLELIPGTDGKAKMSQSLGNAILINDSLEEQFGKLMSLSDTAALQYAKMLSDLDIGETETALKAGGESARDTKLSITENILAQLHGADTAEATREDFKKQFQERQTPESVEAVAVPPGTSLDRVVATGAQISTSDARRVIKQKGVKVDGETITDPLFKTKLGMRIQKGKRTHFKVEEEG